MKSANGVLAVSIVLTILLMLSFPGCPQADDTDGPEPTPGELVEEKLGDAPADAARFDNLALSNEYWREDIHHHNPVITQHFGADPWALVYDDRVYLYLTDDHLLYTGETLTGNNYGSITKLRVISSADLANWQDHGLIAVAGSGGAASWASVSWAPSVVYKTINGQDAFFLYFANNSGGVGVISAPGPLGPWTSPRTGMLVSSSTPGVNQNDNRGVWYFDPAVLLDDDGRAYLYFGGGTPAGGDAAQYTSNHPDPRTIYVIELGDDLVSVKGSAVGMRAPFGFEDSGINKFGSTYYYSYCTNPQVNAYANNPEHLFPIAEQLGGISQGIAYMTSTTPLGPWELQTTFLTNPSIMFEGTPYTNNHHAMFEFRGRQYIAYHSVKLQTTRGLSYSGGDNYRSTHIDRVTLTGDGTLADVPGSLEGPPQIGKHDPYRRTEAETIGAQAGITTETVQGAMAVTGIHSGDWLGLYKVDFGSEGAAQFTARVTRPPSGLGKGLIQIREDSTTGKVIGYLVIDSGAGGYEDITADLMWRAKGVHDLFFVFYGQNWNFDSWQFIK